MKNQNLNQTPEVVLGNDEHGDKLIVSQNGKVVDEIYVLAFDDDQMDRINKIIEERELQR